MVATRACSIALLGLVMAACTEPESDLDLGDETQEVTEQGSDMQGSDMQGSDMQGSDMQGSDMQGSDMQGATYGDSTVSGAIDGTALAVWRSLPAFKWEERRVDRTCTWNLLRTVNYGCSTPTTTPSPLVGASFVTTFKRHSGELVTGQLRIVDVARDTSAAMFPLHGNASASLCQMTFCDHPGNCRRNCDVWTYDVDLVDANGVNVDLCPPNQRAVAIPGTYDITGAYTPSSSKFTFACTNGTIAKCTRWGYRPFGAAKKSDGTSVSLQPYHQACVRAARADYCSNGHSFTMNGTLVDLWDYDTAGSGTNGLIPRTKTRVAGKTGGLLMESAFDTVGAIGMSYLRYEEFAAVMGELEDPYNGCPDRFGLTGDDVGLPWKRTSGWGVGPVVSIDSTTGCRHSELQRGKWLHHTCSTCAYEVTKAGFGHEYCGDPSSPKGWDSQCVARANAVCNASNALATHAECVVGGRLDKYATGCTLEVCRTNPSCCGTGGSWTSACVAAADSMCPRFGSNGLNHTFCGYAPPITPPRPPTLPATRM